MSSEQKLSARTAAAAVFTGLLASACCIGPLVLAILGIGGAGLLVKFEPYRPYFGLYLSSSGLGILLCLLSQASCDWGFGR